MINRKTSFFKVLFLAFFAALFFQAPSLNAQEEWTKENIQRFFVRYLTEEGYAPDLDKDGDIVFKREGKTHLIIIDEDDPEYFRMVMLIGWPMEVENEEAMVMESINYANSKTKVTKAFLRDEVIWLCLEMFVESQEDVIAILPRGMSAMNTLLNNIKEKFGELSKG